MEELVGILNTIKNCRFVERTCGLKFDEDSLLNEAIKKAERLMTKELNDKAIKMSEAQQ